MGIKGEMMGMFDWVEYDDICPECGAKLEGFQSKTGPCELLSLQPKDVRNFYTSCDTCDAWVEYRVKVTDYVVERLIEKKK
jgi:hypothetical protein